MTVPTISFVGQRLHDMGDTDGNTGTGGFPAGGGPGAEPDFFFQGSNAISSKEGTAGPAGFDIDTSAFGTPRSANMQDPRNQDEGIWFVKLMATNKDALLAEGAPSLQVMLGNDSSNYATIEFAGNDNYPIKGGWLIGGISATTGTSSHHLDQLGVITGTITQAPTAADYFAIAADFSAVSKSENLVMDAIDIGMGLSVSGGTSTDPEVTFADIVDWDQGTAGNRYGVVTETDGIITIIGLLIFGANEYTETTALDTEFDDSFFTLVYPRTFAGKWTGMRIDMGGATQVYNFSDGNILGQTPYLTVEFDTETDVDGTGDIIELTDVNLQEVFLKGTRVLAWDHDGTETPGITDGTGYFVGYDSASTGITLHTTRLLALSGGTAVNLTASSAGNGERWALSANSAWRSSPQITFDRTNASSTCDFTRTLFENVGRIDNEDADSGITFTDCTFLDMQGEYETSGFDHNNIVFTDCTWLGQKTVDRLANSQTRPEALLHHNNLADISGCSFDFGTALGGHCIRATSTGTVAFTGNTFTGYATGDQTTHEFDNTDDVDAGTDRITLPAGHGYTSGDPVIYDRRLTANTGLTGLTEEITYYVNMSGNAASLHLNRGDAINNNAPIALTVGTGNETHALWPGNAALYNDSGGLITLNISNGDVPSVRNNLDCTTVLNNNVDVTFTGLRDNTEVRIYAAGTSTELDGIENATAGSPDDRTFTASVAASTSVDYVLHNNEYEYIRVEGFTWPATNQSIAIQQRLDRNYDNPV